MKNIRYLVFAAVITISLLACTEPSDNNTNAEFKYALGNSTDYRWADEAAFYFSGHDSTGRLQVKFANNDSLDLLWITKCYTGKTSYLFGENYGIDSDIMIVNFRNNASTPRYWVLDQGLYKEGSLIFTSWTHDRVAGSFNFDANTLNPDDLSSATLNFQGSFDLPVQPF